MKRFIFLVAWKQGGRVYKELGFIHNIRNRQDLVEGYYSNVHGIHAVEIFAPNQVIAAGLGFWQAFTDGLEARDRLHALIEVKIDQCDLNIHRSIRYSENGAVSFYETRKLEAVDNPADYQYNGACTD